MERQKALAAAATVTLLTATGTIALAATGNSGLLGFGSPFGLRRASAESASATRPDAPSSKGATQIVTQQQDVYDQYVVTVPGRSTAAPSAGPAAGNTADDTPPADPSNPAPIAAPPTTKPLKG